MIDIRESRPSASEVKFIVSSDVGVQVQEWARGHLLPDPYGMGPFADQYRTTTLYFDTPEHDVFHQRGSFARAKYRIRRYADYDFVFLERKLRRPSLLIKRRTQVPLDALARLTDGGDGESWPGSWFQRRLVARRLVPACQLVYRRTARALVTEHGAARLTIDEDLGVSPVRTMAFVDSSPVPALPGGVVVEMKFRGPVPAVFKGLVEELRLSPRTASKFRFGMTALGEVSLEGAPMPVEPGLHV